MYIQDAPTEGSNNYALWVDAGSVRIDDVAAASGEVTICATTGGVLVKRSAACTGSDLAEYYPMIEGIEPGDIVSTTDTPNTIEDETAPFLAGKSYGAYESKMLGVVSSIYEHEAPGEGLRKAEHYHLLALAGRVPVKVSTENGPIVIGDSITSSSTPGVGMKATEAGRVVGIALSSYDSTDPAAVGEVILFVNLHWQGGDLFTQEQKGQLVNLDPEQLRTGLAQLGLVVDEDGTLRVQKLVAQNVEVGTSQNPSGITLYDENGSPRCVKVLSSGQLATYDGTCEAVATANSFEPLGSVESAEPAPEPASDPAAEPAPASEPVADSTPPTISLLGDATVSIEAGDAYADAGATATDDVDGDITASIVMVNPVDAAVIGTYTVTYNVSDAAGNQAQEVARTVQVIEPAPAAPEP